MSTTINRFQCFTRPDLIGISINIIFRLQKWKLRFYLLANLVIWCLLNLGRRVIETAQIWTVWKLWSITAEKLPFQISNNLKLIQSGCATLAAFGHTSVFICVVSDSDTNDNDDGMFFHFSDMLPVLLITKMMLTGSSEQFLL